jgi:hypothetical protein
VIFVAAAATWMVAALRARSVTTAEPDLHEIETA